MRLTPNQITAITWALVLFICGTTMLMLPELLLLVSAMYEN